MYCKLLLLCSRYLYIFLILMQSDLLVLSILVNIFVNILMEHSCGRALETIAPFPMCCSVSTAVSFPAEDPWAGERISEAPGYLVNACTFEGTAGGWVLIPYVIRVLFSREVNMHKLIDLGIREKCIALHMAVKS